MIPLPSTLKIISKEDNKAIFEISGLYPGYGLTIANSLRRVLLSSLSGTAVTKVSIAGVSHEFSTINHVKEDVIQILLNLKKLKFVLPDDQHQVVSLEVKGEKEVTGRDFELTPQVKLVNPGEHIATLTSSKAQLAINITIESGVGYQTVESRESGKPLANEIVLDAAFSPIEKIAYQVENMRVGDKTNFNRIFLTIETNGSITPEKALIEASGLLEEHFKLIASSFQLSETKKTKKTEKTEDAKKMKIADMGLSARITASLEAGGIKTVAGLISKTTAKIMEIEGMGEKGLIELEKTLKKMGLTLKE
jgi:DNA-directed RNA polymerase subunit alpha